jgi:hypothetical protein
VREEYPGFPTHLARNKLLALAKRWVSLNHSMRNHLLIALLFGLNSFVSYSQDLRLFPNYDQIELYHCNLSDSMIYVLFYSKKDPLSGTKSPDYLLRRVPKELDPKLPKKLKKYGYTRTTLDSSVCMNIDSILIQKPHPEVSYLTECSPVYRDILIFKKDKKITGIAQICFSCDQFYFVGNVIKSEGFGQYEELRKLKKVLYP